MSEKLDGMRAVWDGTALYSRAGNPISMPASFAACLPPAFALDGELFLGRGRFQVPEALPALISRAKVHTEAIRSTQSVRFAQSACYSSNIFSALERKSSFPTLT
jgi:DNA ligase-1